MFSVGEWSSELIICLLDVSKNDFGEVDEAMFPGFERPNDLIFSNLGIEKATWSRISYVLSRPMALATRNLPFERLKKRLW
jgi:hypothetical protein